MIFHCTQNTNRWRNTGYTIVEVMVALLVLSVGLLGMASMQNAGLRQSQNTYAQTQAQQLAYNMADRMRANIAGVAAGLYDNINTFTTTYTQPGCAAAPPCDATGMASLDLYEWSNPSSQSSIESLLPQGIGEIDVRQDAAGRDIATITVWWHDRDENSSGADCIKANFNVADEPHQSETPKIPRTCYRLEFRV